MTDLMGPFSPKTLFLPPRMETDRLQLLPLGTEDIDYHWEVRSDEKVMAHFPKVADEKSVLEAEFLEELNEKAHYKFFYAMTLKDEAGLQKNDNRTKTVGTVLLRPTKNGEEVELGYMCSRRIWGQGLVPEASKALIEFGFLEWSLPYIMALISPGNENSERVVEKLGFHFSHLVTDDERSPELNKFILSRDVWQEGAR